MICKNCNFEFNEMYEYCPNCGTKGSVDVNVPPQSQSEQVVSEGPTVALNPAANRALAALKDSLFLVVCILVSTATLFQVLSFSLPVINILFTIFLWITYAAAQKGVADPNHLRCISGTVYANYIIANVASIILIVTGLLTAAFSGAAGFAEELVNSFNEVGIDEFEGILDSIPYQFIALIGWIIAIAFIVGGAAALVFNLLGMRKIHRFAKSFYMGIIDPAIAPENPRGVKAWLIFFAVCEGISALSLIGASFMQALSAGCATAATIISAILIGKYFTDKNYYI